MNTEESLATYRDLVALQRESDRLRVLAAARTAFEDVIAQHDEIQKNGDESPEAAEYLSGRKPVPPPVPVAELIAHARRRIEVLGQLAETGFEGAAEGVAEAEAELDELHAARADCVFCAIAAGTAPATVVRKWGDDVLAIRPRGGVNEGHVLVIPRRHVEDAGTDPVVSARTMERAAQLMGEMDAANIITSKGAEATQSVYHLHIHVVPRQEGDGLTLPWTPQQEAARKTGGAR